MKTSIRKMKNISIMHITNRAVPFLEVLLEITSFLMLLLSSDILLSEIQGISRNLRNYLSIVG